MERIYYCKNKKANIFFDIYMLKGHRDSNSEFLEIVLLLCKALNFSHNNNDQNS